MSSRARGREPGTREKVPLHHMVLLMYNMHCVELYTEEYQIVQKYYGGNLFCHPDSIPVTHSLHWEFSDYVGYMIQIHTRTAICGPCNDFQKTWFPVCIFIFHSVSYHAPISLQIYQQRRIVQAHIHTDRHRVSKL